MWDIFWGRGMLLLMYELKTHLVISKYTKQKTKDYPGIYSPKIETKQKTLHFPQ